MLALWTLDHAGVTIDYNGVPKTAGWLFRTQDLNGGWTYRSTDPGGSNRITQAGVTPGLSVAGACAVLISGDILRLWGNTNEVDQNQFPGLPRAIKLPKFDDPKQSRPKVTPNPYFAALEGVQKYWMLILLTRELSLVFFLTTRSTPLSGLRALRSLRLIHRRIQVRLV